MVNIIFIITKLRNRHGQWPLRSYFTGGFAVTETIASREPGVLMMKSILGQKKKKRGSEMMARGKLGGALAPEQMTQELLSLFSKRQTFFP